MPRLNCWEFKKCGRQPGGAKASELGVCPAASEARVSGANGGTNGGRVCWYIAGTLCGGKMQGTFATKLSNCQQCEFYQLVTKEEGVGVAKGSDLLAKLSLR